MKKAKYWVVPDCNESAVEKRAVVRQPFVLTRHNLRFGLLNVVNGYNEGWATGDSILLKSVSRFVLRQILLENPI